MEDPRVSKTEDLEKQVAELRAIVSSIPGLKVPQPVKISLKYLCPKDPNHDKLVDANGLVMPEDGPVHTLGWITDIKNVVQKHRTFNQDGKEVQFTSTHQTATWKCQTCGSELNVDPYP
jgi:hypothetical protein